MAPSSPAGDAQLIYNTPKNILDHIPAAPAPPGLVSNLINPIDKGPTLAAAATAFATTAYLFVLVRVYNKGFLVRKATLDDGTQLTSIQRALINLKYQ